MAAAVSALTLALGAAQAPPGPLPLPQQLLNQARAGAAALPSPLDVFALSSIARTESFGPRPGWAIGLKDERAAFEAALQLASAHGDQDPEARLRAIVKGMAEQAAVMDTARSDVPAALALARRGDVARRTLYEAVISGAGEWARAEHRGLPGVDVLALVRECEAATGSFPYLASETLVFNSALPLEVRSELAREAIRAAGDERDAPAIAAAAILLSQLHAHLPALDTLIERPLPGMLQYLAEAAASPGHATVTAASSQAQVQRSGIYLLSLARTLDPDEGQELAARYPQFVAVAPAAASPQAGYAAGLAAHKAEMARAQQAEPPAPPEHAAAGERFPALVARAEYFRKRDPQQALRAAGLAEDSLSEDLFHQRGVPAAAARLAGVLAQLGAQPRARALLDRCLDWFEASTAAQQAAFRDGGAPARERFLLEVMYSHGADSLQRFVEAATALEPDLAVRRAQAWRAELARPTVLCAVARALPADAPAQPPHSYN